MSCSNCYLSLSDEKSRKLMYGPLYDKYAHSALADIHLKRTFSNERSLIPQYVPDCCAYVSTNFQGSKYWRLYTALICVWFVYAGIMLAAFLSIRNTQLVKIRGVRATIAYVFTVAGMLCTVVMFSMTSGSDPKYFLPVLMLVFMPFYLFLPILKSLQVLFIYKWHEAKAKRLNILRWFTRWKFVLSIRFYLTASLTMFFVVVVPLAVSLFLVAPAFTGHGRTSFSSLRCSWWHIPEELTVATTNSSMCGCVRAAFFAEGDEQVLCEEGFIETCFSASTTALESELCTSCSSSLTSGSTTSECEDAFINFYASGACGFPSRTPYFDSCANGVFADQRVLFALYAVCYFFLCLHLLIIAPLIFKRDYFGTILESMLTLLNTVPPITSILVYYQFPTLVSWWPSQLPFAVIISVVAIFMMPMITLGLPIILYLWRKRELASKQVDAVGVVNTSTGMGTMESDHEAVVPSGTGPNEADVQQCIASEPLRAVYLKFAVEEFTTENIRFLEECMQTLGAFSGQFNSDELVTQVQRLYDQFIASGSDMEVNIAGTLKTRINKYLQALRKPSSPDTKCSPRTTRRNVINARRPSLALTLQDIKNISPEEQLLEALQNAFVEVNRLMARSSWPRFKESRHYYEFLEKKAQLERHKTLNTKVMAWLGKGPNGLRPSLHHDALLSNSDTNTELGQAAVRHSSLLQSLPHRSATAIVEAVGVEAELDSNSNTNLSRNFFMRKIFLNPVHLLGHRRQNTAPLTPAAAGITHISPWT